MITIRDISTAQKRIAPYVHCTPVFTCTTLNNLTNVQLFFKAENLQKTGAFKFRGACNAVFSLAENVLPFGVATHSSGNHGAALALAAKMRGAPAYIVMPENAPQVKKAAVAGYGANIIFCESNLAAREAKVKSVLEQTGATFIPPYNYHDVIAGQGTAALEFIEEITDLDIIMTPVGGGGLISGTAIAVSELSPRTRIIAAEPAQANDAWQSFHAGKIVPMIKPQTICDGLTTSLGELTFPIIQQKVNDILTATEENIIRAMQLIWERMKLIVEPSAAVTLAVILEHPEVFKHKKAGLILSGGNVDFAKVLPLLHYF